MEEIPALPKLNSEEIRVLGALMEKSRTTPDYYPMTLNALVAACNQKSARKPVVDYDEDTVIKTLDTLKRKGLISTATGGSSRATKYKHNFAIVYPLIPSELAIICLLLLRGPQTPGELNTNSGRLYEFETLEDLQQTLNKLSSEEQPYILQLPKRPGQKEARYMHLLGESLEIPEDDEPVERPGNNSGLETRVVQLETEVALLREQMDKLLKELLG
ncbi:YceH family protein [Mucilaginibacter sp. RS28]|uniref:YceH family protein n=1 Tax=Mucilaginibacter straminoryzae TaxID=2932774 RepID=A0A9X1X1B0_9SPHI|nr:YceH family protein [Mucilaginibacter straminoryzae]MCJ8209407.1 YceH family protein [Mucilaginibacter straminoryzae]